VFSCLGQLSGRSGAEIGLLNPWYSVSQGAPFGDFLLAPLCSIREGKSSLAELRLGKDNQNKEPMVFAMRGYETTRATERDRLLCYLDFCVTWIFVLPGFLCYLAFRVSWIFVLPGFCFSMSAGPHFRYLLL